MWNSEDAKKAADHCSKGTYLMECHRLCPVESVGNAEDIVRVWPIDLGEKDS